MKQPKPKNSIKERHKINEELKAKHKEMLQKQESFRKLNPLNL